MSNGKLEQKPRDKALAIHALAKAKRMSLTEAKAIYGENLRRTRQ